MQQGAGGGGGKKRKRRNIMDSEAMERLKEEFVLGSLFLQSWKLSNIKDLYLNFGSIM